LCGVPAITIITLVAKQTILSAGTIIIVGISNFLQ
jgi:hypothetical protein